MTVSPFARPRPDDKDAELVAECVDLLAEGIGMMANKTASGEKLINKALKMAFDNIVNTDRITARFEPILRYTDFQVMMYFTLFTDPQDQRLGNISVPRITRSQNLMDPNIKVRCAEILCDVVFASRIATDILAKEMFLCDGEADFENACFYAAYTDPHEAEQKE